MDKILASLRTFNTEWNDLPRRLLWIVSMMGCLLLAAVIFPYVAPFAVGAVFAWMIQPVVRFLTKRLGDSKPLRAIVVGFFVLIIASFVLSFVLFLFSAITEEIKSLAVTLPGLVNEVSQAVMAWFEGLHFDWEFLGSGLEDTLINLLSELTSTVTTLASRAASEVARIAFSAVTMLPQSILFVVMTVMATFYISIDRERITAFVVSLLPEKYRKRSTLVRTSFLQAILSQIRTALIMLAITFVELYVGFSIMGISYAALLAFVIAILDALPVLGAGLFLFPMIVYGLVVGNTGFAIGAALIYVMLIIVRQLMEPRIMGKQLGLYPLATMMAMYAGLKLMGFVGMLFGPMILLLCKVMLPTTTNIENIYVHKTDRKWRKRLKNTK